MVLDFVVLGVLSLFTISSILYQFHRPTKKIIDKYDKIGVFPNWSFFAPVPGTYDIRILYRDQNQEMSLNSNWIEIELYFKQKRRFDFFWNPRKYYQKAIIDLSQGLILKHQEYKNINLTQLSWPYITILQHVMREPKNRNVTKRQFLIAKSNGFGNHKKVKMVFLSKYHEF